MDYPSTVWSQLKNITVESLMKALEKDGWEKRKPNGARHPYKKEGNKGKAERIVIHYHPKKTYGPKMLRGLLGDVGWSSDDLKRLKLIK